jgi:hypothetical protein
MRGTLTIIALILICLTWLYTQAMPTSSFRPFEGFMDFFGGSDAVGGMLPDEAPLAAANQPPPLADIFPLQTGLTEFGYGGTAAMDPKRELELNGQYVQRTNNYLRNSPENGTAPFNELVGSIYGPKSAINTDVPCWNNAYCLTA